MKPLREGASWLGRHFQALQAGFPAVPAHQDGGLEQGETAGAPDRFRGDGDLGLEPAGQFLDPYSPGRLLQVAGTIAAGAVVLTVIAVLGIERRTEGIAAPSGPPVKFIDGLREVWREEAARRFTVFVFLSMTAYFMQELILEPFAGLVWGFTPGQSTALSGAQNGGVFVGMLTVGIMATGLKIGSLRSWIVAGCLGSAASLAAIASTALPLLPTVVALGVFNGMFAVAAIGAMMALAAEGRTQREGTRMGLWGAAQAIAAGFGGLTGAAAVDVTRGVQPDAPAFGTVFAVEAALFIAAAAMALHIMENTAPASGRMVPGE